MVTGYFDESGTHGYEKSTVIAGFVGDASVWSLVTKKWREILGNYQVSSLHLADALAQKGAFAGMRSFLINDMCNALARILRESALHPVWSGVDSATWFSVTNEDFRVIFPKPYDLCFREILYQLENWRRKSRRYDRIRLIFASQSEYQVRAAETLKSWAESRRKSAWPLTFESADTNPPLQAADMLVHELYVSLNSLTYERSDGGNFSMSPLLRKIITERGFSGGFITKDALQLHANNWDWDME